jgi:hypothetical protein
MLMQKNMKIMSSSEFFEHISKYLITIIHPRMQPCKYRGMIIQLGVTHPTDVIILDGLQFVMFPCYENLAQSSLIESLSKTSI